MCTDSIRMCTDSIRYTCLRTYECIVRCRCRPCPGPARCLSDTLKISKFAKLLAVGVLGFEMRSTAPWQSVGQMCMCNSSVVDCVDHPCVCDEQRVMTTSKRVRAVCKSPAWLTETDTDRSWHPFVMHTKTRRKNVKILPLSLSGDH